MMHKVYPAVFCLFLVACDCSGTGGLNNALPAPWDVCNNMDFCHRNASVELKGKTASCCQPCSCDERCHVYGNCCPDVTLPKGIIGKTAAIAPCTSRFNLLNRQTIIPKPENNRDDYYRVIQTCPDDEHVNNETREGCNSNKTLQNFVPVSSADGFRMYRNAHCAACHGEENVIEWRLYVTCDIYNNTFQNVNERDEFTFQNCNLNVVPPSEELKRKVSCIPTSIQSMRQCNATGTMALYDSRLNGMCMFYNNRDQYNVLVTVEQALSTRIFANHYCYMCNNPLSKDTDNCKINVNDGDPAKTIRSSLVVLLNANSGYLESFSQQPEEVSSTFCKYPSEIYDPLFKTCRNVTCRHGQMLQGNNACVSIGDIIGTCLRISHTILETSMTTIPTDNGKSLLLLLNSFWKALTVSDILGCEVELAWLGLIVDKRGRRFFATDISTPASCPFNQCLQSIRTMSTATLTFKAKFPLTSHYFKVRLDHSRNFDAKSDINLYDIFYRKCGSPIAVDAAMLESCPKISLSANAVRLQLGHWSATQLFERRIPGPDDGNTYMICKNDYLQFIDRLQNNSFKLIGPQKMMFCMSILVLITCFVWSN